MAKGSGEAVSYNMPDNVHDYDWHADSPFYDGPDLCPDCDQEDDECICPSKTNEDCDT